jgi:hypothetical protein
MEHIAKDLALFVKHWNRLWHQFANQLPMSRLILLSHKRARRTLEALITERDLKFYNAMAVNVVSAEHRLP